MEANKLTLEQRVRDLCEVNSWMTRATVAQILEGAIRYFFVWCLLNVPANTGDGPPLLRDLSYFMGFTEPSVLNDVNLRVSSKLFSYFD